MKPFKQTSINPPVFFLGCRSYFTSGWPCFFPDFTQQLFSDTQSWILSNVSWFYILTVALILLGTVFGVATSLGFGGAQINSGLNYLFNLPVTRQ